jgi:hypothetical protein
MLLDLDRRTTRTGIEPGVEEKDVEEKSWRKFCLFIIRYRLEKI